MLNHMKISLCEVTVSMYTVIIGLLLVILLEFSKHHLKVTMSNMYKTYSVRSISLIDNTELK